MSPASKRFSATGSNKKPGVARSNQCHIVVTKSRHHNAGTAYGAERTEWVLPCCNAPSVTATAHSPQARHWLKNAGSGARCTTQTSGKATATIMASRSVCSLAEAGAIAGIWEQQLIETNPIRKGLEARFTGKSTFQITRTQPLWNKPSPEKSLQQFYKRDPFAQSAIFVSNRRHKRVCVTVCIH